MTEQEKQIIERAAGNADTWGAGRLTYAKVAIEDNGYTWTAEHEAFLCELADREFLSSR